MKLQDLHEESILEHINNFLAEGHSTSAELKDLIHSNLESPIQSKAAEISKTVSAAAIKLKAWALEQMKDVKIADENHKSLLKKIINNPETVARELAMNIIKRRLQ